ncbi:MAG: hypothetical protein K1000chlam3_00701 [Chlamydiae bacterium]|nr:hypothetical protein [Chlamydiota bacterium]
MRLLLCLFLFTACTRANIDGTAFSSECCSKPTVVVLPVEDEACTFSSLKIAESFTKAVTDLLEEKEYFSLEKDAGQFLVQMQLIELQENGKTPSDLSMSILLKILDMQNNKVILKELFSANTLLEKPLSPNAALSQNNEEFRISPMGLAHAKLSRKIAMCIEENILRTN